MCAIMDIAREKADCAAVGMSKRMRGSRAVAVFAGYVRSRGVEEQLNPKESPVLSITVLHPMENRSAPTYRIVYDGEALAHYWPGDPQSMEALGPETAHNDTWIYDMVSRTTFDEELARANLTTMLSRWESTDRTAGGAALGIAVAR
jgi:hypothetical protein